MTRTVQTPASAPRAAVAAEPLAPEVDRYEGVKQYSLRQILAVWAAAAVPMGVLAWIVAPLLKDQFGKRDWVANGAIFALYHLHMPWAILPTFVDGIFLDAYPSRRFQSAWMGIIVHSAQSVVLVGLVLALVLA